MPRSSVWGERIAAACMAVAAVAGLAGVVGGLRGAGGAACGFPWPAAGNGVVGLDALSAFFLAPILLVGGIGPLYGLGYWPQRIHRRNGRKLRLFWGLLVAGMALLVIGRHAMSFLLGWEIMALSAFFLVATEDERKESRRASWIYLVATHVSTLTLFGLFALWRSATGSYLLEPVSPETLRLGTRHLLFLLALIAFGIKAGMMPLHFWLPGAHASAPCHVSAILSGVVLKMGIYGLVRWLALLPVPPAAWGSIVLALGVVSGLLGVVYAIGQHDIKRLLAYHSVENIGIILMGLGIALLGRSTGHVGWVVLGMGGCLLHVWNHSLFKSLLFLAAGAVVHGAHTRQIDRLGGLARGMPWSAAGFLVGAVAICGLPPLNGFVSELFIYLGLFHAALAGSAMAMVGVPVLAAIGALAVACFVKVYGTAFLGVARTPAAAHAREAPVTMRMPLLILAACCAVIGLAPVLVAPALDASTRCWMAGVAPGTPAIRGLAPLGGIGALGAALVAGLAAAAVLGRRRHAARRARPAITWDCGYARPSPRMQYTATSLAQMIVGLFAPVLRPHVQHPRVDGLFPAPVAAHSHVDDAVLDRMLLPMGRRLANSFGWFRRFQRGLTQNYMLYILIMLLVLLGTLLPIRAMVERWLAR
ncbi:MAG: hydrogenase [Lentisphaerae bacterium]|nr:hydrogenase [Lentisphaerota bacterium]